MRSYEEKDFVRLVEKLTALILPRGLSALSLIQDQVRLNLTVNTDSIVNELFREEASDIKAKDSKLHVFLQGLQLWFPRFI